tara:strand:- start:218 stop:730 length:513 start_codon:yes stop_codon:yes gene_type:complete
VKKNLVLLGMMAVGKTTIGKLVAKKEGLKFIDTDKSIEKKFAMKISEIFKEKGENFFRTEEKKETLRSLNKVNCVIAIGGGAFMNKIIRNTILKKSVSIWLDVNLITLDKRIKWNKNRPLLSDEKDSKKRITELYNKRKNIYKLADYRISCDNLSKENIVNEIVNFYKNE